MGLDIAGFRTRFPEFANATAYPDPRIQLFLDDAALCIDEVIFDKFYTAAVCYLAAHELFTWELTNTTTTGNLGNAAKSGTETSKTVDKISVSRGVNSMDPNNPDFLLSTTKYGQKYMEIRNKVPGGFIVLGRNT